MLPPNRSSLRNLPSLLDTVRKGCLTQLGSSFREEGKVFDCIDEYGAKGVGLCIFSRNKYFLSRWEKIDEEAVELIKGLHESGLNKHKDKK